MTDFANLGMIDRKGNNIIHPSIATGGPRQRQDDGYTSRSKGCAIGFLCFLALLVAVSFAGFVWIGVALLGG